MLPLHTQCVLNDLPQNQVLKVLRLDEALGSDLPPERIMVDLRRGPNVDLCGLAEVGFGAVLLDITENVSAVLPVLRDLNNPHVVAPGDVVRVRERGKISVLYRRGANANSLFITERCNSHCLMCSQPPREGDDDWRVDQILDLIPLIDRDVPALAITGGEPTLLGHRLAQVLECVATSLPDTQLNILTNARLLSDPALAEKVTESTGKVLWSVPLYADTATRHDYVVQARGAFDETVNGIYNLAERRAAIEIRIVLHQQTIGRLLPFAEFIWRTMPFVTHVAFMGLEPMGFAKVNRELLYLDPLDYREELEAAVWYLHDRGITASIYNTPLCLLSREVWPLTKKSISDWKNTFAQECESCTVRGACGGFFVSAGSGWRSRGITPFKEEMCPCPRIGGNMCVNCSVGQAQV